MGTFFPPPMKALHHTQQAPDPFRPEHTCSSSSWGEVLSKFKTYDVLEYKLKGLTK